MLFADATCSGLIKLSFPFPLRKEFSFTNIYCTSLSAVFQMSHNSEQDLADTFSSLTQTQFVRGPAMKDEGLKQYD